MEKYLKIFKKSPLFQEIAEDDLLRMLTCLGAKILSFGKRQTIMAEGSAVHAIGLLLSGSAQVIQLDYDGNRSILSGLSPSEVFAEEFACAMEPSLPIAVVANEPCEVMLLDSNHILHTCANHCAFHRQLIYNLTRVLARKTVRFHSRAQIISCRTTRERLLTYLLQYAKEKDSRSFDIPFDRQALADYLEVDRSGLSTEIGRLRREGVLDSHKRHFVLH